MHRKAEEEQILDIFATTLGQRKMAQRGAAWTRQTPDELTVVTTRVTLTPCCAG
jgi:hypothetical protein